MDGQLGRERESLTINSLIRLQRLRVVSRPTILHAVRTYSASFRKRWTLLSCEWFRSLWLSPTTITSTRQLLISFDTVQNALHTGTFSSY